MTMCYGHWTGRPTLADHLNYVKRRNCTGTPMVNATEENDMPRDKHWMGLVEPDDGARRQLHFVQNLDPLRVLRCSLEGMCRFIQRDEQQAAATGPEAGFIFRDSFSHLRGGTPFELYRWPYFVRYVGRNRNVI